MKINVYTIVSSLHDDEYIKGQRERLFSALHDLTNYDFELVNDPSKLYEGSVLGLILVESGGSENEFLKNIKYFKQPYIFLTYPHNNSLAASLEILTYLRNNNLRGEILHGSDDYIASRIREIVNNEIKPTKLGIIGKPSDWLISSGKVDEKALKDKFNIELVNIDSKELLDETAKHNEDLDPSMFKAKFDYEELKKAYHIYLSLRNIVNKYDLKGFTIRCFDLLNTVKSTSCLALALLNDEGIIAGCEGDIPAMISMYAALKVLHQPSFMANPSLLDVNNRELIIAHCTIPLKMTTSYKFDTHFESNIGIGIKGELKEEDILLFRISSDFTKYAVLRGTIEENLNRYNLCRTQIKVKIHDDITYFLKKPLGNHHIIVYGSNPKELEDYLDSLNLTKVNK